MLIPDNAYGPSKELARNELARWGIAHRFYDAMDPASLAAAMTPATRLVWLEAPGSVTMEFPDLPALVRAVARARGVLVALDNTWGAGLAFDPFAFGAGGGDAIGVDISVHALDQVPVGRRRRADGLGDDARRGPAPAPEGDAHAHGLGRRRQRRRAGAALAAVAAAALRGAGPRRRARSATWWSTRPEIVARAASGAARLARARALGARSAAQAAGLFSVVFDARLRSAQVDAFVDALKLFRIGYSWAGPISLVVPYDLADDARAAGAGSGTLVRFSIGLEAVDDLIADCAQALAALGAGWPAERCAQRWRSRRRIVRPAGVIVNDIRSSGSPPSAVATLSISKRPSSVASAIFISSIASWRPGQTRGPAPNGIETRLGRARRRARASACSQRSGSKRSAFGEVARRAAQSLRIDAEDQRAAPERGCRRPSCRAAPAAISERRHRLQPHRLVGAGLEVVERGEALGRPAGRLAGQRVDLGARALPAHAGCVRSSQIAQASVLAVVSSPASSIVITLPATSRVGDAASPGSSAATIIASSRLRGAARRSGSAARRRARRRR